MDLSGFHRLNHVMIESRFPCSPFVPGLPPPGDCDKNAALRAGQLPQISCHIVAIQPGQPYVEKNEIRLESRRHFKCLQSVVRNPHLVARRLQDQGKAGHEINIIVH